MCKTISILTLDDAHSDVKLLQEKLEDLRYDVRKVLTINRDIKTISVEIEDGLKRNDFLILIDLNLEDTLDAVCAVFHTELYPKSIQNLIWNVPKIAKILDCDDFDLKPVIYLGRLFIIQDNNIDLVYKNILKDYFEMFNKEKRFSKIFYFVREFDENLLNKCNGTLPKCNGSSHKCNMNTAKKDCNSLIISNKQEGDLNILEVNSTNLKNLVEYQKCLAVKGLSKEVYAMENIYTKNFHHVHKAIECIESCFLQYQPENVFLSFNGGKDCTVLLHLTLGVLRKLYPNYKSRLICMYIQSSNPFIEVNEFIQQLSCYYNLEIYTITETVKEGLQIFLRDHPHLKACLMGTRRSDPYSQYLNTCQMTDPSWPQVMRVSPLLDWEYSEIWDYLLYFQVPYCILYDWGYTSLGSVNNTAKNPALLYKNDEDEEIYLPAYKLLDGNRERDGRN